MSSTSSRMNTTNNATVTADDAGVGFPVVLKNTLIITSSVVVLLLILIYLFYRYCCTCRCFQRKQPPRKIYENAESTTEYHGYDEIKYRNSMSDDGSVAEKERLSRSLSHLDLDLDTNSYLTPKPPTYSCQVPVSQTGSSETNGNLEIAGVEQIHKGVSVKIKDGRFHKIIDIQFQ